MIREQKPSEKSTLTSVMEVRQTGKIIGKASIACPSCKNTITIDVGTLNVCPFCSAEMRVESDSVEVVFIMDERKMKTAPLTVSDSTSVYQTVPRVTVRAADPSEERREVSVRGGVSEADHDDLQFTIRLFDGRKLVAPIDKPNKKTIFDALVGYDSGVRVLVKGIGVFSRQQEIERFESVEEIVLLDALDVPSRLEEMLSLKDGWLDGEGVAPTQNGLQWLTQSFERLYPSDLPPPHLFPTPEGGIQAEWIIHPFDISIEINLESRTGEWHSLNLETREDEEQTFNFDEPAGWEKLAMELRTVIGKVNE